MSCRGFLDPVCCSANFYSFWVLILYALRFRLHAFVSPLICMLIRRWQASWCMSLSELWVNPLTSTKLETQHPFYSRFSIHYPAALKHWSVMQLRSQCVSVLQSSQTVAELGQWVFSRWWWYSKWSQSVFFSLHFCTIYRNK